jgi:hypothetical protein|tara:strand:+ start:1124 stop:1345 length:222 start_codon:yes stop_codon:yes gene_type:complete
MAETEKRKKTELELVAGLFRNTDKNGNVYYTGKSESGVEYVMFRNTYWKEGASKPYFRVMMRVDKKAVKAVED